ncbi:MAG: hypothetical protein GY765_26420 [bacterium]|nr:hypothetical protein [bacterium]
MTNTDDKKKVADGFKCKNCAATLEFKPGTTSLTCKYCGVENAIDQSDEKIEEIDFVSFMKEKFNNEEKIEVTAVSCNSCGASISLEPGVTSDSCPYCASNIVVKGGSTSSLLKPKSMIPFVVDKKKATESFRDWIQGLWFAPSNLKKNSSINEKLSGIYVPYWTYDSNTYTTYDGERGTHYYVTETYMEEEDGESVTRTREVQHTQWYPVSGYVHVNFDDVLINASRSLPEKHMTGLEPWNMTELLPYNDKYLGGFRSESYQVDVAEGFEGAKIRMEPDINMEIYRDIGGDEQRVISSDTDYRDITFKHILLPIWISSYRYSSKVYRFLINGQTGEVQGERPYSWIKISLAVLAVIAVIVLFFVFFK